MGLYERSATTVLRLFTKYGMDITLRRYSAVSGGDYDPDTGSATPVGSDGIYDETRKAVVMDQPGSQIAIRFGAKYDKDSLVQTGEKWVYMEADGAIPTLQDHVILGGVDYAIIDIQVTAPGGTAVLYLIVLKR